MPEVTARASVYPQRSLADMFKGSADANQRPDPAGAGYPQQSLIRSRGGGANPAATERLRSSPAKHVHAFRATLHAAAGAIGLCSVASDAAKLLPRRRLSQIPRIPRQQSSAAPSPRRQGCGAHPAAERRCASRQSGPTRSSCRTRACHAAPAAPPASSDYSDSLPYPKQSLADVFRGSTESRLRPCRARRALIRHGTTYTPQGQAANGAPAGGAAAAPPAGAGSVQLAGPYPKQSLFEVFSNNKANAARHCFMRVGNSGVLISHRIER